MKRIKLNDKVVVISGDDKGKIGKVLKVNNEKGLVIVEEVNIVTKHLKKRDENSEGIVKIPGFISISKVSLVDDKNKPVKAAFKVVNGKKERTTRNSSKKKKA